MPDVKDTSAEPSAAPQQFNGWDKEGTPIVVKSPQQDEAPAASDAPKEAESEPKGKSAAESEPAKESQERKGRPGAEDRIRELVAKNKQHEEENRQLKERLERLEKGQTKADPSPAPKPQPEPKAPVRPKFEDFLKKHANDYEKAATDFEEAQDKYFNDLADFRAEQKLQQAESRRAQEAAQSKMQEQINDAKGKYPDWDEKAGGALKIIMANDTPQALKVAVGTSDVMLDLVYAIGPDNVQSLVDLAKVNPVAAVLKLGELQAETRRQLQASKEKPEPPKANDPPARPKPTAPKPVSEVGGRAASPEDALTSAAKANDFAAFEREQTRRALASRR